MQGPAIFSRNAARPAKLQLAAARLAPRQKKLLQGVLALLTGVLDRRLDPALAEIEKVWFQNADQARSTQVQAALMQAVKSLRDNKAKFVVELRERIESALAAIADGPVQTETQVAAAPRDTQELSLVETGVMDQAVALNEIASRLEIRASAALFMLGQRFGVIAGKPAYDAERLPIGPHGLCLALRDATDVFGFPDGARHDFYRQFDKYLLTWAASVFDDINAYLVREKVLPNLVFSPVRRRVGSVAPVGTRSATTAAAPKPEQASPDSTGPGQSHGQPMPLAANQDDGNNDHSQDPELFDMLRQLLSSRRQILGRLKPDAARARAANAVPVSPQQLQKGLSALQNRSSHMRVVDGKPRLRQIADLRQDLLAQFRHELGPGADPALPEEQSDTMDLVGMLFDQIVQEPQMASSAVGALIAKLQVPMLRIALNDKTFFTAREHPARQLLNAVADASYYWTSDDEQDRELIDKMGAIVDRLSGEFDGDPAIFTRLMGDLAQHLGTQQRKADVTERRHVEAARGREKLEVAKLRAEEVIAAQASGRNLPRFVQSLLEQTWVDVLALALLRGGEESPAFRQHAALSARLIDSAAAKMRGQAALIGADEAARMHEDILAALGQIGYQGDEAKELADRLLAAGTQGEGTVKDDPASRTELAMKLKNRVRLGQAQSGAPAAEVKAVNSPLSEEEVAWVERIKTLPFGTWFDFTINQQGAVARRRLSWFSTVTGHCLFVNHRGQRVGEYNIGWLARELHRGNVKLAQPERESLVDRAWNAIVRALKAFSGGGDHQDEAQAAQA